MFCDFGDEETDNGDSEAKAFSGRHRLLTSKKSSLKDKEKKPEAVVVVAGNGKRKLGFGGRVVHVKGLRDDTTCIVIDILPPEKANPPLQPPKKTGASGGRICYDFRTVGCSFVRCVKLK
ncbi:hypothetical protein L1987_59838 [Smallanthus sonchifolius]|uniref:Uncharacterized protein n=1 Tax=Smallanthus sonchifolius TaxID=185202 RepID=A0ACB9D6Z4_9ASTR|nr:hypothetical protein L1987_59838 [Smallanthus sonchifolius]